MVRNEIFFQLTQFDVKKLSLKSVFFLCIQKESYNFTTHDDKMEIEKLVEMTSLINMYLHLLQTLCRLHEALEREAQVPANHCAQAESTEVKQRKSCSCVATAHRF